MQPVQENRTPNRLSRATSPYLLQHAYNPVDWHEWGPEPLEKAVRENKPILISIGYSSCHWCHVMEHESFENVEVAKLMNDQLVCIKVDREERPDIDQIYMDAVQAMGQNGGWPLNVFLTPDQKPFYGGTYFPTNNWTQLIIQLSKAFRERRTEIDLSADDLVKHLNASDLSRFTSDSGPFNPADFQTTFGVLESKYDSTYGGLDRAPKFVMPTIWLWLLRYHHQTQSPVALNMALTTLRQIASGGIYDHLGGGFSRYSVDNKWFAPHFEKMLYDNAQLVGLYAEAFRISPDPLFRQVVYETAGWLRREMKHPEGAFYSALDADSEGSEGKFYTWTEKELDNVLGRHADLIKQYFQTTPSGNWEHGQNILHRIGATQSTASIDQEEALQSAKDILFQHRSKRVRPALDDKIVTGWNAMMIQGYAEAYKSFGDPSFLEEALIAIRFLEERLMDGPRCYRTYKTRHSQTGGFIEDYALLISAYLSLYECTFDESWVNQAEQVCQYAISQFRDEGDGFFFFAGASAEKLVVRKKEIFDNVMPSPNSVMARNLFRLGVLLDREEWKQDAIEMATSLKKLILKEPTYMSNWGMLAMEIAYPFFEIVITGPGAMAQRKSLASTYQPFSLMMGSSQNSSLPLVKERTSSVKDTIHVCVNNTCRMPVSTVAEALEVLSSNPS